MFESLSTDAQFLISFVIAVGFIVSYAIYKAISYDGE